MPSIPALAKPYAASKSAFFAGSSSESYSSYLKPSVIDNLSETVISWSKCWSREDWKVYEPNVD